MELWNENSLVINNIQYIDYNLIEKISLVNETNKYREASKLTNHVICGTSLKSEDLIIKWKKDTQKKYSVFIEAHTMKLIVLSGGKNLPWTNARRELIIELMGVDLFPTCNQEVKSTLLKQVAHRTTGTQTETDESIEPGNKLATTSIVPRRKGAVGLQRRPIIYWKYVLLHARRNKVSFDSLIDVILQYSKSKQPEYLKSVIKKLFPNLQSREAITSNIAISLKSGKAEDLLFTISSNLKINEKGKLQNIVPSYRAVQRYQSRIMENFISVCKPEATFSGFRCDLVSCVKFAAWILYGRETILGLNIDLWGDGCEIGGNDHTRMCFRILQDFSEKITAQSSSITFCFSGKLSVCFLLSITLVVYFVLKIPLNKDISIHS